MSQPPKVRVAVVQAESCWFDLDASIQKTIHLIEDAAKKGAQLVAFPEVWVPGYPAWIWCRPLDLPMTKNYIQNSLPHDSPHMEAICTAAAKNHINVCLGYSENENGSLYIAQSFISSAGEIKMTRRKIKPTHMERTVYGDGNGGSLNHVVESELGRVGCLSCWEHTQPLLKYHSAAQGEQIHIAAWPPLYPFDGSTPDAPLYSLSKEGAQTLSRSYAIETQSFVLFSTGMMSDRGIEAMKTQGNPLLGVVGGGCAAIFGPDGRKLSEDLPATEEGVVVADLDMEMVVVVKSMLDVVGHYSRPDLLRLVVDTRDKKNVEHEF